MNYKEKTSDAGADEFHNDFSVLDELPYSLIVIRDDEQIAPMPDEFGIIEYKTGDKILHPITGEPRWEVLKVEQASGKNSEKPGSPPRAWGLLTMPRCTHLKTSGSPPRAWGLLFGRTIVYNGHEVHPHGRGDFSKSASPQNGL